MEIISLHVLPYFILININNNHLHKFHVTANESSTKLINFNKTTDIPSLLNITLKDNDIHKRASDYERVNVKNYSRYDNNITEPETHIILNQILNFIENRYNTTKDTYASACKCLF